MAAMETLAELVAVVKDGDADRVAAVLQGRGDRLDRSCVDHEGFSPLYHACLRGHTAVITLLCEHGWRDDPLRCSWRNALNREMLPHVIRYPPKVVQR